MSPNTKTILKGFGIGLAVVGVLVGIGYAFTKPKDEEEIGGDGTTIIIGDSQTPFITKQSKKIQMIGGFSYKGGEEKLWEGNRDLKWLKKAVSKYPVSKNISNVVINIGTNGAFSKNDDVNGLIDEVERVFPNAKLFAVQGSWGWGANTSVTPQKVKEYYDRFKNRGVVVVNPPIGAIEPHGHKPIYKEIGKNLDSLLQ